MSTPRICPCTATRRPDSRPCRSCEMSPENVARAIPKGCELAPVYWLATVRHELKGDVVRADFRARILRVAELVFHSRTPTKGVSMPGVSRLALLLRFGIRTVQRALLWLKDRRLLVTVARGRSADWSKSGQADREVFALVRPVEKTGTPSFRPTFPERSPMRRAHDFMRRALGASPYRPLSSEDKDAALWHGHKPAETREDQLLATHELMRRLRPYAFKGTRTEALLPVLAPFFDRGATVKQLLLMLDTRPDGSPVPHDGANGVRNYVAWTSARLSAWQGLELP